MKSQRKYVLETAGEALKSIKTKGTFLAEYKGISLALFAVQSFEII